MRIQADTQLLDISPGQLASVTLDVVNTSDVIDGISARVIGLDDEHVTTQPPILPLFPDASGQLKLQLGLPPSFPAGRHPLTIEVSSRTSTEAPEHLDLDLVVGPHAAAALRVHPTILRVHRRGRFRVEIANRGNVPLELALSGIDPDRLVRSSFTPPEVEVPPGTTATALLTVRGPRHLFGSELDRVLQIRAVGNDIEATATATLRQRARIPRGVLTVVILASIVGLWAGAFLLGMTKVFGADPLGKDAPPSYFIAAGQAALTAQSTPTDVLPKSGPLPPGVGALLAGTVKAKSNGTGVGRIVVEALRSSPTGLQLVSSAATQADGSYSIVGLLPGAYLLRFSGPGFQTVYYPSAPSVAGAKQVNASAAAVTGGLVTTIVGAPASIIGRVDPGETAIPVRTVVTARLLDAAPGMPPLTVRTVTAADGSFRLANLTAPASYQVGFTAAGYQPTTLVENLTGGQQRYEPTVRLSAGNSTLSGTVSSGGTPLGGVSVTTTVNGQPLTTGTPTQGAVGQFVLTGLPTPATYVVTFSKAGYASDTEVVDLAPGQQSKTLAVSLVGGTGSVSGRVVDESGNGIGGASVAVGGTANPMSTTTLTTGEVGLFALSGMPSPGTYTVTVSLPGYAPATVPVTLEAAAAPSLTVTLTRSLGTLTGQVLGPNGKPYVGATVSVTDGTKPLTTTSVDSATTAGAYTITDLHPGAYSVTVTAQGYGQQTSLVQITAGQTTQQNLQLQAVSSP